MTMCEVTGKNFEEIYPKVVEDLHSASFISIDCEFSGLFDDDSQISLFDSPKARFEKLQSCLETVKITQFGLSTFKYETMSNTFSVATYTFYLKPSPVIKKQKFVYQMGSIEFLCKHNFDFNKLFYDGVFYLNKSHEKMALKSIDDRSLLNSDICEQIQNYCSRVAEWSANASEGSEMELKLTNENKMFVYILHGEIRKRFINVWTFFADENAIRIRKVRHSEKVTLATPKEEILLKKKLFDSILGFTKVIKELESLKKPIIGHNFFIDLILIYKQFFNPLPVSYENFKSSITKIFPIIYDTKLISFKLRDILPKDDAWSWNSLSTLYDYLRDGRGATLVICTPTVNHKNENFVNESHFHQAGFDSYCTGYCFLKMSHIFSLWDERKKSFLLTSLPTSSKWLLGAMSRMKNQVNLPRAQVKYILLDGDDPKSVRPGFLYIYSKTKQPLDVSKVTKILAKHPAIEFQLLSEYSGLLAPGNQYHVREIQKCFKNHKEYRVTKYNFLKHSKTGKSIVSGTVILTIILTAIFASNRWRGSSFSPAIFAFFYKTTDSYN